MKRPPRSAFGRDPRREHLVVLLLAYGLPILGLVAAAIVVCAVPVGN